MENDSIRASGTNTLIDLWIDGKLRAICVSEEAIGGFVGFAQAVGMSDKDRCDFVRRHLGLIMAAAKAKLQATDPAAESVLIDSGQLPRPDGRASERRKGDRRKAERRLGEAELKHPDRRRGERRTSQRRRSPKS